MDFRAGLEDYRKAVMPAQAEAMPVAYLICGRRMSSDLVPGLVQGSSFVHEVLKAVADILDKPWAALKAISLWAV